MIKDRDIHGRTSLLLGSEHVSRLSQTKVIIFGVGGVGSWCAEALIRSGISHLTIVDSDKVCVTNCNRQLMATTLTIGQPKVMAMKERLLEINPNAEIEALDDMYCADNADSFHLEDYDFIVDAIDSLTDKADLIIRASKLPEHITFISSMGAALRTDPLMVTKAEFWKVSGDPLARALRHKFKHKKIYPERKFTCIFSSQPPLPNMGIPPTCETEEEMSQAGSTAKGQTNGSLCTVTAVFGMAIAAEIINKCC